MLVLGGGRVEGGPHLLFVERIFRTGQETHTQGESLLVPTPAAIAQKDFIRTCLELAGSYLEDHPRTWIRG